MFHGKSWALPFHGKQPKHGDRGGKKSFLPQLEPKHLCWKADTVSLSSEPPALSRCLTWNRSSMCVFTEEMMSYQTLHWVLKPLVAKSKRGIRRLGALTLCAVENLCVTYSQSSVSSILHPQIQPTIDSTKDRSGNTVLFTT